MGIILKKNVAKDSVLGIWEITEDYDELLNKAFLNEEEENTVKSFGNYQRKLEWLSVRVLLNELLNRTDCRIVYNVDKKPFLSDNSYFISISHSRQLTSILLSKTYKVGIDLEYLSHKIQNISHKFINENEWITHDNDKKQLHLYIHWCAKEALYKICDKQDINFKQNLTIIPFHVADKGKIIGVVYNKYRHEEFKLHYFTIDGYVIVWCIK